LLVAQNGTQRVSSRSIRLTVIALATALVALTGAANPTPATAAGMKVVVIVGPVGSSTASYKDSARRYASQARSYGASVTEIYSPNATWSRVKAAAQGANVLIYLGHGNGSPSPYGAFSKYTKDGFGLNRTAWAGNNNTKYWGEYYVYSQIHLAPNAVVILNRLCYAVGQLRVGHGQPDQDRGQDARPELRLGLPPRRRAGDLRRGDHERVVHPVRPVQDDPHHRRDLQELSQLEW
jgi:hypothetical protein